MLAPCGAAEDDADKEIWHACPGFSVMNLTVPIDDDHLRSMSSMDVGYERRRSSLCRHQFSSWSLSNADPGVLASEDITPPVVMEYLFSSTRSDACCPLALTFSLPKLTSSRPVHNESYDEMLADGHHCCRP
jgi:hypothetical protein